MRKKANNYLKLLNPFTTLAHTGEGDIAPTGKFALSRDPKTNLALWNTIGVSSWAIPLAIAANVASNRYWKKEIEKARKKRTVSKLEALRPRLSPDSDLDDISNIVDTPEEENRLIEEIEKKASDDDSGIPLIGDAVSRGLKAALPILAAPTALAVTTAILHKKQKEEYKKQLLRERLALRNMHDKIQHDILVENGLLKGAKAPEKENTLSSFLLDLPVVLSLGGAALAGAGTYHYLSKKDKNKAKIEFLKKKVLGSNTLQDTPQISLDSLPAVKEELIARTGDKNPTLMLAKSETLLPEADIPDERVLEEVIAKKRDALFS